MHKLIWLSFFFSWAVQAQINPIEIPADPNTAAWVVEQNARSRAYLKSNLPLYNEITARAAELTAQTAVMKTSFFNKEFYVSRGSLLLVDPSGDKTIVNVATLPAGAAVTEYRLSPDQTKLAFGYAIRGTDWTTWKVIDFQTLTEIDGPFYIKSSGVDEMNWDTDSKGLYYQNWLTAVEDEAGMRKPQVRYHRIGESIASDVVVFEDESDPKVNKYNARPLDANRAIVYRLLGAAEVPLSLYIVEKDNNGGFKRARALMKPNRYWGRLVGADGNKVLVRTSYLGKKYGILSIDANSGRKRTIVPENSNQVLIQAQQIGDRLVLQYLNKNLDNSIVVTNLRGQVLKTFYPHDFGFPDQGTFGLLTGNWTSQKGYFNYQTMTTPSEVIVFDVLSSTFTRLPTRPVNFDGSKVVVRQSWYFSDDGTKIPISVFTRQDMPIPNFMYVLVYGNIGIANTPQFNRKYQLMLDMGGAVAIPNIRGGGEWGLSWQQAGVFNKWNTINDIKSAAQWLRREYPSLRNRLVLSGRSYGGMMTMTAYSHLQPYFAVYTPVVGVSDPEALLRQERGWVYWDDMGFQRDLSGEIIYDFNSFVRLFSWSPLKMVPFLSNAKPIMAFSAQYDSRVSSSQTIRYIQALHTRFGPTSPVYIIEHENVGHNGRAEVIDEAAFIAAQFGIQQLSPLKN